MNKIQKYALENGKINVANLARILDEMKERCSANIDYLLGVILGFEDIPTKFPWDSIQNDGKRRARFKEYNLLEGLVLYEYDEETRLWFKNKEDAETFSKGGGYYNLEYTYSKKDGYEFEGVRPYVATSYCSRDEWFEGAVK